jgi:catechol 2,3-dioxygenase-like lactoylglutathione lyase family enzyme
MKLEHIDHVAITVRDLGRSIEWYTRVLGLEHRPVEEWGEYPQMVCAGETCIALFPADRDDPAPPPGGDTLAMQHVAFRLGRESFDGAREHLGGHGITPRFADHGTAHSLYLADPDGHSIELTCYEVPGSRGT